MGTGAGACSARSYMQATLTKSLAQAIILGALGGTLNGDPCSLLGVIWVYKVLGLGVPSRGPS